MQSFSFFELNLKKQKAKDESFNKKKYWIVVKRRHPNLLILWNQILSLTNTKKIA